MSLRVNFNETWEDLKEAIKEVITLGSVKKDVFIKGFAAVYSLCVASPESLDKLYYETKQFLENHVKNILDLSGDGDINSLLLQRYVTAWTEYSQGIKYLNHLYSYLNRVNIRKQKLSEDGIIHGNVSNDSLEQMEIGALAFDIWRVYLIQSGEELVKQILEGINADRVGSEFNSQRIQTIPEVIQTFIKVQNYKKKREDRAFDVVGEVIFEKVRNYKLKDNLILYQQLFETPMLAASGEYYRIEASKLLQKCSVSQYMEEVIKKLNDEYERAHTFLHESSKPKLGKECEERMITDHMDYFYFEFKEMVSQDKWDDLKNMYNFLKPIPNGLKNLMPIFLDDIKNEGIETISTLKGENIHVQFVENMLEVHQKYKKLILQSFYNDPLFLRALDKAIASVVNKKISDKQPCRSAELVAKYCDCLLKKSKSTETEIDLKLANSITIFKYIDDKDVYEKFYSKMLAKRLIHEQSHSMDSEESMINRLKQECGYEFTNKLHRMFTDISVSADLNNKFNNYLKDNNYEIGINLSIKVLQSGAWPLLGSTTVPITFAIPQEFEKSIGMFEKFYHINFNGRKLTWLHHFCHGELKVSYLKKPYIITMHTFQMAILVLFETCDVMTCKDIQETLQLNNETLQKHIQSLIESKLLLCGTEKLEDSTEIKLNLNYSNKRTKFKITAALQRETPQEVEHTIHAVDEDRKMYLQAAIVRIMKSRKKLRHNALIQEILSQSKVSFTPSIRLIKKSIETLIEIQYIERAPNSSDEYNYVA